MKILKLLFFATVLLVSCSKQNRESRQYEHDILGTWELDHVSCGACPPGAQRRYPAGNGNTIKFTSNNKYVSTDSTSSRQSGKYRLYVTKECSNSGNTVVEFDRKSSEVRYVSFWNDKLVLSSPYCWTDITSTVYRKVE